MKGVFAELKRRNVFRVAVTYAVAAWIVAQVAGLSADAFDAPAWVMQMIITALIVGFLPAVVVAWAFELTPEGVRRERDLVDREMVSRYTARRLDIAVIILLVLAIGLIVGDRFLASPSPPATVAQLPDGDWRLDSIAVLPFADFSPSRDQAWLGEGIADTLLHALAQVEGLSVSARSSSFAYRGREADVATIGRELSVATVLEGSVQRVGERLRVSAQLVRADTQAQLFSRTFERETDDIFAIQDEIALAVTEALLGSAGMAPSATARTGTATYDLYLEGRQLWQERTAESVNRAVELLEQAVAADPDYAPAQAELAIALLFQTFYAEVPLEDNRAAVERHVQRALDLDRDNALAWAARGHLLEELGLSADALEAHLRAEALDPGNANIQVWVGNRLYVSGRFEESAARFERALELDPLNPFVRQRYMTSLGNLNSMDPRIERVARDSVRLFPDRTEAWQGMINLLSNQDRNDEYVLMAFDAHQRFPDAEVFPRFIGSGLDALHLHEDAERWSARADLLSQDGDDWITFRLHERDPEEHLRRARLIHQRWGDGMLANLLQSLRLNGHYEEAHGLFNQRFEDIEPLLESGQAGLDEYVLLPEGIWLALAAGEQARADRLIELTSAKLEELRAGTVFGSLVVPDLHLAVASGELARASELLRDLPPTYWAYMSWALRSDPAFADMVSTPEARQIIEQADARRRDQSDRLLAQAPPGLLGD